MGPEKCIGPFHLGLDRIDGNPVGFGYFGIALAVDDKGNEDFPSFVRHPIEQFNDFIVLSWLFRMGLVVLLDNFELRMKRSEEHTSELQSRENFVCRLLLEKKKLVFEF